MTTVKQRRGRNIKEEKEFVLNRRLNICEGGTIVYVWHYTNIVIINGIGTLFIFFFFVFKEVQNDAHSKTRF